MSRLSSVLLLLSAKAKTQLVTKCTNNFYVSDVIRVIEGVIKALYQPVYMTTVMLHLSMHSNAQLFA